MHLRRVEIKANAGTSYIRAFRIVRHNDCFAFGDRRDAFRTLDDRCGLMERAIRNHVFRATTIRFLAAHRQEFVLDDGVVCPIAFGILNGFRFGHLPEQIMRILNHLSHCHHMFERFRTFGLPTRTFSTPNSLQRDV